MNFLGNYKSVDTIFGKIQCDIHILWLWFLSLFLHKKRLRYYPRPFLNYLVISFVYWLITLISKVLYSQP